MNLAVDIKLKLKKNTFNPKAFLNRLKFSDEAGRDSARYTDPNYIPFYFYLGETIEPVSVIEFGFHIGLISGTFFTSCKSVENFLAFQQKQKEYYSFRLGRANIWNTLKKKFAFHYGEITDDEFIKKVLHYKWDCVLLNDEQPYQWYVDVIDLLWNQLNLGAVIVFNNAIAHKPTRDAYNDICRIRNREPVVVQTRYGTGLLER